jgi:hypothetical protein
MPTNNVPSDLAAIHTMSALPPPTLWDLYHWIAVRDSFLTGTVAGWATAKQMETLWGPQRRGLASHPSLPALCAFVRERWGPRPPPARWWPNVGETWVGLDTKACLDLRHLLCQDLAIRPSEADRLVLSDVADHFCSPGVPFVPPSPRVELAGEAVRGSAGAVRDSLPAGSTRGKGKMIDERMLAEIRDNPGSLRWSAQKWADRFKCSKSTIAGTKTWKDTIRLMRIQERCERRAGRSDDA